MPDISMCSNGDKCPRKEDCYRFKAKPAEWQAHAPFYREGQECANFTPTAAAIKREKRTVSPRNVATLFAAVMIFGLVALALQAIS